MSRMNDLSKAIIKLEHLLESDPRTFKNSKSENGWIFDDIHEVLKILKSMSCSEFPNNWIPNTKKTVPKDPLRKQIQLKNGWIITGWFDEEDWNWYSVPGFDEPFKFEDVVAWCELPPPYQPKSEETS